MAKQPQVTWVSHKRLGAHAHIAADQIVKSADLKRVRLRTANPDNTEDRPSGFPFTRN